MRQRNFSTTKQRDVSTQTKYSSERGNKSSERRSSKQQERSTRESSNVRKSARRSSSNDLHHHANERRIQHGSRAANKRHALEKSGHHWNVRCWRAARAFSAVWSWRAAGWCKRTFSGTPSTPAIVERTSAWAQIKCWFFLLNYSGSLFIGACFVPRRVNTKFPAGGMVGGWGAPKAVWWDDFKQKKSLICRLAFVYCLSD